MCKKILLIDDEDDNREVVRTMMEIFFPGMLVLEASNGAVGLQIFEDEHPDVIFSDIDMPIMDGIELLKKIREKSAVPFFFCTGRCLEEDDDFVFVATGVISKPYDINTVREKISAVF